MASSHKIISLCLCLILASCVFIVEGQGFSGMLGGGGGKHGSHGLELLLAAGLLGKILSRNKHHHHGHHHHGHHHEGRSASGPEYANAMPYAGFEAQQPMQFMAPYGLMPELGQEFAGLGGWQ
ncbi:hypothetical protein JTE90_009440 [Oedothorax gibbosus]|uniref:Uncharacterized protein n=1 Tax=Oedothorax gibbosus TaxID=931172 RepID=A0AAV6VSC3_9ARAC|nr:hypothetical protein JTE90_009440 [Oedothorax gibbosus]